MAMVQPKSQKLRLFITHLGLLIFIAAIMFPLLMVIAISLREGNFATGSLIPEKISWEHWRLALGFSVEHADGRVTPPPFPVLLWLQHAHAVLAGQAQVQQHGIVLVFREKPCGFPTATGPVSRFASIGQSIDDRFSDHRVVFDKKNLFGHRFFSSRQSAS